MFLAFMYYWFDFMHPGTFLTDVCLVDIIVLGADEAQIQCKQAYTAIHSWNIESPRTHKSFTS